MIWTFLGAPALSAFRLERLSDALRRQGASIVKLDARYVYFMLALEGQATLAAQVADLLRAEAVDGLPADPSAVLVLPRAGTLSPWSSKATDIVRRCGYTTVQRVERGILYRLDGWMRGGPDEGAILALLYDRMTQRAVATDVAADGLFESHAPRPLLRAPLHSQGRAALEQTNQTLGLALSEEEIDYLELSFRNLERDPTDVELMMFAQANSEHCRHKIFNASWVIDGQQKKRSLFGMIVNTSAQSPYGILSAYGDNAAVVEGAITRVLLRDPLTGAYGYREEPAHLLMKVETHNHPTAISPYPGAATGAGGEIRDEAATGQGSCSKAGLTGFSVSHLRIPGFEQDWEVDFGRPPRISSALEIMLEGPIGAASFNNEFGRPVLAGYFRTFLQRDLEAPADRARGYHKPIMIAGGMGSLRPMHRQKEPIPPGAPIVVLGGPAMLIGLGGGAASSQASGAGEETLDYASVQRENAEMQRRCQEVISQCNALGEATPILSIHDVGAGGLANAVPELVHDAGRGGRIDLRAVPSAEPGMSPLEIWCNEAQERFVLALKPESLSRFRRICEREQCPYAVIGEATQDEWLLLEDPLLGERPVDVPMSLLFGKPPKMLRNVRSTPPVLSPLELSGLDLHAAVMRVLRFPAVADKSFLITIGDRSVGGLVVRDQMVGPWQVPVADVAVTASGFQSYTGEAMAMGERSPLALISAPASGRMAVGEAITNLAAARIDGLEMIKLSANWMAAAGVPGEDARLFDTVKAVAMDLCPELDVAIPVGKDSLSMQTRWRDGEGEKSVLAPLSLVISAFAPVRDVRKTLTPQLKADPSSWLILIDLGAGRNRLGGSALAQVYGQMGNEGPDLEDPELLKGFYRAVQDLNEAGVIMAYHDRSDGGLLVTLCEMAFAGRCGLTVDLEPLGPDPVAGLFTEELGAVIQVSDRCRTYALERLAEAGLAHCCHVLGRPQAQLCLRFEHAGRLVYEEALLTLHRLWSETSYRMQALRDNPLCAGQQYRRLDDETDPGLHVQLAFDPQEDVAAPYLVRRPKVAILREQGVNGHAEMAAAFDRAGFTAVDVHMNDLLTGQANLGDFVGLAACGGFSYGDVLGAGRGWAATIRHNLRARDAFQAFFARTDTFTLGVCNGCQMLAHLRDLIPGAGHWPEFVRNLSEQYEARLVMVEVLDTPSLFFAGMSGSRMPVVVAHGEGRAQFAGDPQEVLRRRLAPLCYTDHYGHRTEAFPHNPNGSPAGITALTSEDGRATIMMPHPERCFRGVQYSWRPDDWGEAGPWLRLFRNARVWVG